MAVKDHTDDRASGTDAKFYLPAGVGPSFDGSHLEGLWTTLFNHQVGKNR